MGFRRLTGIVPAHDASEVDVADHADEGGEVAPHRRQATSDSSRSPGHPLAAATRGAAAAPAPSSPLAQMRLFHGRRRFASREEQGGQGSKLLVKALLANQVPILKHLADPG